MGALFKFILIAFCVIWLLSKIMKYAFRYLLVFTGKQVQKEMEKQMQHQQQATQQTTTKDGTRIIFDQNSRGRKSTNQDSEYIDYEEVD